ncbi:MAG: hypothetical protein K5695_12840 [Oscillospiraceae bacterium]|nr:hypothetical protein [Oscillospiraceae bacterium]
MKEIDKERLLRHIAKSDLTAVEKRYLEGLVLQDQRTSAIDPDDTEIRKMTDAALLAAMTGGADDVD